MVGNIIAYLVLAVSILCVIGSAIGMFEARGLDQFGRQVAVALGYVLVVIVCGMALGWWS